MTKVFLGISRKTEPSWHEKSVINKGDVWRSVLALPSALWQQVKGALWPLHPDLTGLGLSWAILFTLSPHRDLAQLLSDLKQEAVASHWLNNLCLWIPFVFHVSDTLLSWLHTFLHTWHLTNKKVPISPQFKKMINGQTVLSGRWGNQFKAEFTCASSSFCALHSFWAKSSWLWHSDSCSFSWTQSTAQQWADVRQSLFSNAPREVDARIQGIYSKQNYKYYIEFTLFLHFCSMPLIKNKLHHIKTFFCNERAKFTTFQKNVSSKNFK